MDNRIFTFQDDEGSNYNLTYFMSNGSWSLSFDNINDDPLKVDIKQKKQLLENWLKVKDYYLITLSISDKMNVQFVGI